MPEIDQLCDFVIFILNFHFPDQGLSKIKKPWGRKKYPQIISGTTNSCPSLIFVLERINWNTIFCANWGNCFYRQHPSALFLLVGKKTFTLSSQKINTQQAWRDSNTYFRNKEIYINLRGKRIFTRNECSSEAEIHQRDKIQLNGYS